MNERMTLDEEITKLEHRLCAAKARRDRLAPEDDTSVPDAGVPGALEDNSRVAFHNLLVLSDSALPLGSFSFSSGLESYMAHLPRTSQVNGLSIFKSFLSLSLDSVVSAVLPYVAAGYLQPGRLSQLDNDLDASTSCAVAKRASIAQGRALLAMWDRSLRIHVSPQSPGRVLASRALQSFSNLVRNTDTQNAGLTEDEGVACCLCAHFPPLLGVLGVTMGLSLRETLYLYLLSHCKTLLSAGIRASLFGPYQSQGLLASEWLSSSLESSVETELKNPRSTEEAGQSVPVLDIWGGRHDILYSRIFNS